MEQNITPGVEPNTVVLSNVTTTAPTKTVFGAISAQTPMWANWVFRAVFILTSAVTIWIAGTELISTSAKVETMLILKMVDALVLGFSKLFGVVPDTEK